jgi:hypothetical protein
VLEGKLKELISKEEVFRKSLSASATIHLVFKRFEAVDLPIDFFREIELSQYRMEN